MVNEVRASEGVWEYRQTEESQLSAGRCSIPIDDALFERVGKELGISTGQAKKLYYEARKLVLRNTENS